METLQQTADVAAELPAPVKPAIINADELRPGHVAAGMNDGNGLWREVAAAERVTGTETRIAILWRGGQQDQLGADWRFRLADDDTATAWRADRDREVARAELATDLRKLLNQVERGELPGPADYTTMVVSMWVADEDLPAAAATLGVPVADGPAPRCDARQGRLHITIFGVGDSHAP